MSNTYAVINSSGAVECVLTTQALYIDLASAGIPAHLVESYYYDFGEKVFLEKKDVTYELRIEGLTAIFENIPPGLKLLIDGLFEETTSEEGLEVQFDSEGRHTLHFSENIKYQDKLIELDI